MTAERTADTAVDEGTGAVHWTYTMDQAAHTAAIRAWFRTRRSSWPLRLPVLAALEALAVTAAVLRFHSHGAAGLWPAFWLLPLLPPVAALVPRLVARSVVKANAHHGEITATVTEQGVRIHSPHADFSGTWANFGRYLETPDAYLLLSPDKGGNAMYPLAKRGLASDADAARLHTLVTTHLDGSSHT